MLLAIDKECRLGNNEKLSRIFQPLRGKVWFVVIHTAAARQIKKGFVTDVYFERTREVLRARGIDKEVSLEFPAPKER